jgi:hypothetical protein
MSSVCLDSVTLDHASQMQMHVQRQLGHDPLFSISVDECPPDLLQDVLNNRMSSYYVCYYHISGLNGVSKHLVHMHQVSSGDCAPCVGVGPGYLQDVSGHDPHFQPPGGHSACGW